MAISCDPSVLAQAARCFNDCHHSHALAQSVKTYLLCQYSNSAPSSVAAPSNPDIDDASISTSVTFTWTNNASPAATTNEIWSQKNGGAYALLGTVAGNVATFTDNAPGLVNGDERFYKVRACNGTTCSAFTDPRSVALRLGTLGIANYNSPFLVIHFGNFDTASAGVVLTVNFALLRRVKSAGLDLGSVFLDNEANLVSVSMPSLQTVPDSFLGFTCPKFTTLVLTSLQTIGNSFQFGGANITGNFALPALTSVVGLFDVDSNPLLTGLSVPVLSTVGADCFVHLTAISNASFPSLQSVGGNFRLGENVNLLTVSCPALTTIGGGLSTFNSAGMTSMSFPVLANMGGASISCSGCTALLAANFPALIAVGAGIGMDVDFSNCTALASISFPNMFLIGDFAFSGCAVLTSVTLTNATFSDGGFILDFFGDAVAAGNSLAGTGINGILHRGAVSPGPLTSDNFNLNGGTNAGAAALSAQGTADAAFLTGNGNTVTLNP